MSLRIPTRIIKPLGLLVPTFTNSKYFPRDTEEVIDILILIQKKGQTSGLDKNTTPCIYLFKSILGLNYLVNYIFYLG